jgi:hypothetical protein
MRGTNIRNSYAHGYIKNELVDIDFKNIPLEEVMKTCNDYNGIIRKEYFDLVVEIIQEFYADSSNGMIWNSTDN